MYNGLGSASMADESDDAPSNLPALGRPSIFTDEIADEIARRLAKGEPLAVICRDDHMPARRTVYLWTEADPDLSARIARAREDGFDAIAAETLEIADDDSRDWEPIRDAEGHVTGVKVDGEHVSRSKLRIETRLKLLAKWDPKRYGDKLAIGGDADAPPIRHEVTRIERVIVDAPD